MISSLKNQKEFDLVNKFGEKFFSPSFIAVISIDNPKLKDKTSLTLGMKVSKKLSKSAVIRNKIRRRVRHLIRLINPALHELKLAIIIIPKKNFEKIPFTLLLKEFEKIPIIISKVDYLKNS